MFKSLIKTKSRLLFLLLLLISSIASAEIQIGAKTDGYAGLSLIVEDQISTEYHVAFSVEPEKYASLDVEYLFLPYYARVSRLFSSNFYIQPYYGFGIRGEMEEQDRMDENFFVKVPAGVVFSSTSSPIRGFLDISPMLGPIQKVSFRPQARIGLRTRL